MIHRAAGSGRSGAPISLALLAILLVAGSCKTTEAIKNVAKGAFGGDPATDAAIEAAAGAADVIEKMKQRFSPEQEYYLGRAVAAHFVAQYGLDPDERLQEYVRLVGAALVELSPRIRGTYGGYHFAVLATDKPNGMSAPGGFVFVTRGALALARSEEEVAAILSHEIAHVSLKHGEAVIRAGETWKTGIQAVAKTAAAAGGAGYGDELAALLGKTAGDFAKKLAETGYGRDYEYAADAEGSRFLAETGYDAGAVASYLTALPERPDTAWQAHPESGDRIARLRTVVAGLPALPAGDEGRRARDARFAALR